LAKETRILYVVICAMLVFFLFVIAGLQYNYGVAKGELKQMNIFKEKFMPDPKNVFPDATLEPGVIDERN